MAVDQPLDEAPPLQGQAGSPPAHVAVVGEYLAVPGSVRQVRDAVARLAEEHGAVRPRVDDIRLAVSEAATNVVMHAYSDGEPGSFRIFSVVGRQRILVVIEDDGCGLSQPACTPGLGAGMALMRQVAEETRFSERRCGGSSVQMRLALQA